MDKAQEIRLQEERRKVWKEGMEREKLQRNLKLQDDLEQYAAKIVDKINKPEKKSNKDVNSEIQSNVCSVCLQLMIPPEHQPMILFPCGHNVCQTCLLQPQHPGRVVIKAKARIEKCPLCRNKIESYALNRALMTLICTYTNNKELLALSPDVNEDLQANAEIDQLRVRCDILVKEQQKIHAQVIQFKNTTDVLETVISTLYKEKIRNQNQINKLMEEKKLIQKHLIAKQEEQDQIVKKYEEAREKQKMIEKTLTPLLREKEKKQLLQVIRLNQK